MAVDPVEGIRLVYLCNHVASGLLMVCDIALDGVDYGLSPVGDSHS